MKIWPVHRQKEQSDVTTSTTRIDRPSERFLAANGQQVYCLPTAKPSLVPYAVNLLRKHYGFNLTCPIGSGGNELVAHIRRDNIALYVAWDCWSGFDIMSLSDDADPVVCELATYFDTIKYEVRLSCHFDDKQNAEQDVHGNTH